MKVTFTGVMAARVEMGDYLHQRTLHYSRVLLFLNPMADINIKVHCFVQGKFVLFKISCLMFMLSIC